MALTTRGQFSYRKAQIMRTRKAVITIALAAAALGAPAAVAAPVLAAPAAATVAAAHAPYVGHNVGGGLLTRQRLHVGQVVNFVGSTGGGRISNYRVTAVHRDGAANYVTIWPRLQSGAGQLLLFTTSK
jgi:hypothetical protein